MTLHVYAIQCEGFVKIGVSRNPRARCAVAQTLSPFPVHLVGSYEGSASVEKELHRQFSDYKHRGEWFLRAGPVAEWCASLEARSSANGSAIHIYLKAERGRSTALAAKLGIAPSTISQWHQVPAERVRQVSRATGIPPHELRPDLYEATA